MNENNPNVDRIEFINQLEEKEIFWEPNALIASLIYALTPVEACKILNLEFEQDPSFRRKIIKKITQDMDLEVKEYHNELIDQLILGFERLPYNKKQSSAYCLEILYEFLPKNKKEEVMNFFLSSKYIGVRRRGYKIIESNWNPKYKILLEKNWNEFKDPACARLIVARFPSSFIVENLDELEGILINSHRIHIARLYIRIGENNRSILNRLEKIDGITYAYVLAKLRFRMTEAKALELFEANRQDDRVGLLLWSFGQIGLWSVLENITNRVGELEMEKFSRIYNNNAS